MKGKIRWLSVGLALLLGLAACAPKTPPQPAASGGTGLPGQSASTSVPPPKPDPAPAPDPEPGPAPAFRNPLTGESTREDLSRSRPIAVMLNNFAKALPQAGVSQADLIYEILVEGGITRMLGVFQSVEGVGEIGTVRSARDYFVSLAHGHDAIYLHAGGSPQAYDAIRSWGVTALDCVNGPYEGTLFWRDPVRRKNAGLEHSVLTSGEKILELLPTYKRVKLEHREGYSCPLEFLAEGETASGSPASRITVKFSKYKTKIFDYSGGLYAVSEPDRPYTDANTGEQVFVKNVVVLYTDISSIRGDTAGRLTVRITGEGKGHFFCDGTVQEITWYKKDSASPLEFTGAGGQPLKLGVGSSYINIVGGTSALSYHDGDQHNS